MLHIKASTVRSAAILSASVLALALSGCKHSDLNGQVAEWTLIDPKERHPILVSKQPTTLALSVPAGSSGLRPQQRAELLNFASRYRASDAGDSRIIVEVPTGSANEVEAMHASEDIRNVLNHEGFGDSDIAVEAYYDDNRPSPAIRVSYLRYVAEGPECGNFSSNMAYQPNNVAYPNFGCSAQNNLAAQIANPADLLGPRTMTPRDSARRDQTYTKYVRGESTGAQKSNDERIQRGEVGGGN